MEVLDYFKTPKTAQLNQRIFVKEFVSLSKVEGKGKTLIEKNVSNIHLVDIYNEDRTGIWQYKDDSYSYEEILLFHLVVKDKDKVKQLNEEIQKLFPNPIIIIYQFNNQKFIFANCVYTYNRLHIALCTKGFLQYDSSVQIV